MEGDKPGRILGYQASVQGEFIDKLLEKMDNTKFELSNLKARQYFPIGKSGNAVLIPPKVPFRILYSFSVFFKDCEFLKSYVQNSNELSITIQPILENSTYIPEPKSFVVVKVDNAQTYDCLSSNNGKLQEKENNLTS